MDPAKRLEAYLVAEGVPLEAEGIRGFLATGCDRTIIIDEVGKQSGTVGVFHLGADRATSSAKSGRSARCGSTGWVRGANDHS